MWGELTVRDFPPWLTVESGEDDLSTLLERVSRRRAVSTVTVPAAQAETKRRAPTLPRLTWARSSRFELADDTSRGHRRGRALRDRKAVGTSMAARAPPTRKLVLLELGYAQGGLRCDRAGRGRVTRSPVATSTLQGDGFVVSVEEEETAVTSEIGDVIEQVPAAGTSAQPGSTVTITVGIAIPPPPADGLAVRDRLKRRRPLADQRNHGRRDQRVPGAAAEQPHVPAGISFRVSDGALFCTDDSGDELWRLDPTTGAAISGTPWTSPSGLTSRLGLAFRASDDALFVADDSGDELWQSRPWTGAVGSGYPVDLPSGPREPDRPRVPPQRRRALLR